MKNTLRAFITVKVVFILSILSVLPLFSQKNEIETDIKPKSKKQINLLGMFGLATSHLNDALLDIGVEFQVLEGFYVRLELNSHLDVGRNVYYDYYPGTNYGYYYGGYGVGFGFNDGTTLHGISTFGVYKMPVDRYLNICFLAGLSYLSYWRQDYDLSGQYWTRSKRRGYGGGIGVAVEYYLSEKFGIVAGSTYRKLFENQSPQQPDEPVVGKPSWTQFYVGLNYLLKGIKQ